MDSSFQIKPTNKKSKQDDLGVHGESFRLENLPTDVIIDILTRLPISSLIQFRLVCKPWKLLSTDPQLSRVRQSNDDDPTLIFHSDYPIRNHLSFVELSSSDFDNNSKIVRKIHIPFSNSMPEFNVIGSANGLLCLSDSLYGEPVFIFNPFSMDYTELPKSKRFQEQEVLFGFGFEPVKNEYKVVKIVYYRTTWRARNQARQNNNRNYPKSEVQIFTVSSKEIGSWRSLGKVPYRIDREGGGGGKEAPPPVVVNGRIHWVGRPGRVSGVSGRAIVSFDLKDENFEVVAKPNGVVGRGSYHLAVVRGCLAAVVSCGYGKLEIWVMKEYGFRESWVKEFVIHGAFPRAKMGAHGGWGLGGGRMVVRVLCVLKNGEILMEYRGGSLVRYDPKWKEFKDVVFSRMPRLFQTIVHVGTLNWVH